MFNNLTTDLRSHYRITADKREIKDFPKLPSATFFIRKTLYEIASPLEMPKQRCENEKI